MKTSEIKDKLEKMVPEIQTAEEAGILIMLLSKTDKIERVSDLYQNQEIK